MEATRRRAIRRRAASSRRTAQVARVLARHGMGSMVRAAGSLRRPREDDVERPVTASRYAAAASELGPAFVRLAHALSVRADVLAPDERAALAAAAAPEPVLDPDAVQDVLVEQLGAGARRRLAAWDHQPVASGPATVTYAGTLAEGEEVVITLRRPGLAAVVQRDLDILRPAGRLLARRGGLAARVDIVAEIERFRVLLEREIDLELAASVLDTLATITGEGPEVVWDLTASGVVTVARGAPRRAETLLRLWRQEGIVVLDPAGVGHGAFRSMVATAPAVDAFAALSDAVARRDPDAVLDLLLGSATRGGGIATARLRGALLDGLEVAGPIGVRVEHAVRLAGEAGLTFDGDLCFMLAALRELEVWAPELTEETVVRTLRGPRPAHERVARADVVARSRRPVRRPSERTEPSVGLALSGGSVRGAAHAAAIEVLVDAGVRPDFVAGTSAGSIVGALLAAGTPPDELVRVVSAMRWSTVARPIPSRLALFDADPLEAFIETTIGPLSFEDLLCPLAVVACDLLTGEMVVIDSGPVATAVRASAALPGIFPPVDRDGRLLIDGGVVDNLPVGVVRKMGADYVIAIDVSPPITDGRRPRGVFDVLLMASDIMMVSQHRDRVAADVTINPDVAQYGGWSIAEIPDITERGRVAAEAVVDTIRRDLGLSS